jgi:arsenate reductase
MAEAYMNHVSSARLDPSMSEEEIEIRLKEVAPRRWRAFSAGSKPTGRVNPVAIETLAAHGVSLGSWMPYPKKRSGPPQGLQRTESGIEYSLYSKSWDEFAAPGAPLMDAVVTVCDNAAERCPVFPGRTAKVHHAFRDPARAQGTDDEVMAVFREVRDEIREFVEGLPELLESKAK